MSGADGYCDRYTKPDDDPGSSLADGHRHATHSNAE
jgi:hypothetical protein